MKLRGLFLALIALLLIVPVPPLQARLFLGGGSAVPLSPLTVVAINATGAGISGGTGTLNAGKTVTLTLTMSLAATVASGTPTMTLNSGGTATYSGGTGTTSLTFTYVVGASDNAAKLAVASFNLNGATIRDASSNNAITSGALAVLPGTLVIDTQVPLVASITTIPSSGILAAGNSVAFKVNFSEPVIVAGGTPTLALNVGANATYASGSFTSTLTFNYTVQAGQNAAPLATTASAIALNGATIRDAATNSGVLTGANSQTFTGLNVNTSTPTSCGTNYYVGGAGANDGNPGTNPAAPWATIGKVNSPGFSFGAGTCITQQASLTGRLVLQTGTNISGVTPSNRITYDCGNTTITSSVSGQTEAVLIDNVNGFNFQNCTVRPHASKTEWGVHVVNGAVGTVQNNDIGGFSTTSLNSQAINVFISLNSSGNLLVYQNAVHGLSGTASPDDNGIYPKSNDGAVQIIANHIYDIEGRATGGNLQGATGNGIAISESLSGPSGNATLVSNNLIHNLGGNTNNCGGPSGILVYATTTPITIRRNEVHHVRPLNLNTQVAQGGCDWDGIDFDGHVVGATMEENYIHDNAGAGLTAWMGQGGGSAVWGPNTYRNNISENDYASGYNNGYFGSAVILGTGATNPVIYFYNNTIYRNSGTSGSPVVAFSDGGPPGPGSYFENNLLYAANANSVTLKCNGSQVSPRTNMTFKGNGYYQAAGSFSVGTGCGTYANLAAWQSGLTGGDVGATTANPNLVGPIPVSTCTGANAWTPSLTVGVQPCPPGYKPVAGSAYLTGGSQPVTLPTEDYYLKPIPSVGPWPIGASSSSASLNVGPRVAVGPQSTITCPGGSVAISSGTTIQTVVNANPAGTSYCLGSGTFSSQSVTPKNGDRFTGATTTILDGGGTTARAFDGSATGVTVQNMVITNYKPGVQRAVIGKSDGTGVDGWTLRNLEVKNSVGTSMSAGCSSCGATGIAFQSGSTIVANYIHNHPALGFSCYGPNDVITDNEIAFNNPWSVGTQPQVDPGWEAGGNKCWGSDGETIAFNYSHDNGGPGLWFDSPGSGTWNTNATITNNRVTGNYYNGIMWEVSKNAVIAYNSTSANGGAVGTPWTRTGSISCATNWLWCAEILSSSSSATAGGTLIDIHNNTLVTSSNGAGISILSQGRGDSPGDARNVHVYNNTVTLTANSSYGLDALAGAYADNNYFHCDSFTGGQTNFFWNGGGQNLASFQGNGQENNGGCASVGAGP